MIFWQDQRGAHDRSPTPASLAEDLFVYLAEEAGQPSLESGPLLFPVEEEHEESFAGQVLLGPRGVRRGDERKTVHHGLKHFGKQQYHNSG